MSLVEYPRPDRIRYRNIANLLNAAKMHIPRDAKRYPWSKQTLRQEINEWLDEHNPDKVENER